MKQKNSSKKKQPPKKIAVNRSLIMGLGILIFVLILIIGIMASINQGNTRTTRTKASERDTRSQAQDILLQVKEQNQGDGTIWTVSAIPQGGDIYHISGYTISFCDAIERENFHFVHPLFPGENVVIQENNNTITATAKKEGIPEPWYAGTEYTLFTVFDKEPCIQDAFMRIKNGEGQDESLHIKEIPMKL